MKKWTHNETEKLKQLYPGTRVVRDILSHFPGRGIDSVRSHAYHLGFQKLPIGKQQPLEMSSHDAAYLAGFIDADGSISIRMTTNPRRRKKVQLHATIAIYNTNVEVMNWLANKIGGQHSRMFKKHQRHKDILVLQSRSVIDVAKILRTVLPYLIVKRRQAEIVLEFCENRILYSGYTEREFELKDIVQALNHRGPV